MCGAEAPVWFREPAQCKSVLWSLPVQAIEAVTGVYVHRMTFCTVKYFK